MFVNHHHRGTPEQIGNFLEGFLFLLIKASLTTIGTDLALNWSNHCGLGLSYHVVLNRWHCRVKMRSNCVFLIRFVVQGWKGQEWTGRLFEYE